MIQGRRTSEAEGAREDLRARRQELGRPALPPADEWSIAGYGLQQAGRFAAAADAYRRAAHANPVLPQAHLGLGRALLDLRDAAGAAAALRAALEADELAGEQGTESLLDDPDEDPWYLLGMAEHLRGDFEAALEAYGRSADRYPEFCEPLLEIARCRLVRGERAEAAAACERILAKKRRPSVMAEARALLQSARS